MSTCGLCIVLLCAEKLVAPYAAPTSGGEMGGSGRVIGLVGPGMHTVLLCTDMHGLAARRTGHQTGWKLLS